MNTFFTSILTKLKIFFGKGSPFQQIFSNALKHMLSQVAPSALDILSAVAMAKVSQVDNNAISNKEKRQEVLNALEAAAIKEGIQVGLSTLNLILETAVTANKKK